MTGGELLCVSFLIWGPLATVAVFRLGRIANVLEQLADPERSSGWRLSINRRATTEQQKPTENGTEAESANNGRGK